MYAHVFNQFASITLSGKRAMLYRRMLIMLMISEFKINSCYIPVNVVSGITFGIKRDIILYDYRIDPVSLN